MHKTTLIMVVNHTKPLPELTDLAAARIYTLDGVEDVTAEIVPAIHQNPDSFIISWLADRMVHVYGESPNVDFVQATRRIAAKLLAREGGES